MRRREFIALLCGMTSAWPAVATAQQLQKIYRVGVLETTPLSQNAIPFNALRSGLQSLGYVEGQNLVIEYRSADGHAERFPELAQELVRLNVDLIVIRGAPAALAVKNASSTMPVVSAATGEPLDAGLAASLSHPGGNFTGLSSITNEIEPKRIALVRELIPGIGRIAFLYNMSNPIYPQTWREIETFVRSQGIQPQLLDVRKSADFGAAFEAAVAKSAGAIIVGVDGLTQANRQTIVELARKHRLLAIYPSREFAEAGGLIGYGVSYPDLYRRAANYVDKILRGASPSDLPIEQPTKFELVVNLKTAKVLEFDIPATLLAIADDVIE